MKKGKEARKYDELILDPQDMILHKMTVTYTYTFNFIFHYKVFTNTQVLLFFMHIA